MVCGYLLLHTFFLGGAGSEIILWGLYVLWLGF